VKRHALAAIILAAILLTIALIASGVAADPDPGEVLLSLDGADMLDQVAGAVHSDDSGPWANSSAMWIERGAKNMIKNPSFELNLMSWSTWNSPAVVESSSNRAAVGDASARITTDGGSQGIYQDIVIDDQQYYHVRLSIYPVSVTTVLLVRDCASSANEKYAYANATNMWNSEKILYTPEPGQTCIRIFVLSGAGNEFYVDSVQLSMIDSSYIDGSLGIGYGWDGAAHASSSTRTTSTLSISPTMSGLSEWAARLVWSPQYASTDTWPDGATLLDARGAYNTDRVKVTFDDGCDCLRFYVNGSERGTSSALSFDAGDWLYDWISVDFNGDLTLWHNGTPETIASLAGLSPTEVVSFTIGHDVFGASHANALWAEVSILDRAPSAAEAASTDPMASMISYEVDLTDGLVAWWDMEEQTGPRYDSHSVNHLTDFNTVGYTDGIEGNAAKFVSANNEVLKLYEPALAPAVGGGFAVSTWISQTARTGYDTIIARNGAGGNRSWGLQITPAGVLEWHVGDATISAASIATNTWHHIVGVYDGSDIYLYIDSARVARGDGPASIVSTTEQLAIGSYLNGGIDNTQIYLDALNQSEIDALYNGGAGLAYADVADYGLQTPTPTAAPSSTPTPMATPTPWPTVVYPQYQQTTDTDARAQTLEMPGALPQSELIIQLPRSAAEHLPAMRAESLPGYVSEAEQTGVAGFMSEIEGQITTYGVLINSRLGDIQSVTDAARDLVGDPQEAQMIIMAGPAESVSNPGFSEQHVAGEPDEIAVAGASYSLAQAAVDLSENMNFAFGYVRAVADIGPIGLDLIFIFLGLGWLVFVKLTTLIMRVTAWLVRMLFRMLGSLIQLIGFFLQVISVIAEIIKLIPGL
jgi:hypothetical protein